MIDNLIIYWILSGKKFKDIVKDFKEVFSRKMFY